MPNSVALGMMRRPFERRVVISKKKKRKKGSRVHECKNERMKVKIDYQNSRFLFLKKYQMEREEEGGKTVSCA